jgi:hypothetical protein
MSRLREDAADAGHVPFEIRALEALLMAVSMRMSTEASVIDQDSAKVNDTASPVLRWFDVSVLLEGYCSWDTCVFHGQDPSFPSIIGVEWSDSRLRVARGLGSDGQQAIQGHLENERIR